MRTPFLDIMEIRLYGLGFTRQPQASDYSVLFTRQFSNGITLGYRCCDIERKDEYIVFNSNARTSLSRLYKGHEADIMVVVERFIDVLVSYIGKDQEGETR